MTEHARIQKRARARKAGRAKLFREDWLKSGGGCFWCGEALTPETASVDHVIPFSKLGKEKKRKDESDNWVVSCPACQNKRKDYVDNEGPQQTPHLPHRSQLDRAKKKLITQDRIHTLESYKEVIEELPLGSAAYSPSRYPSSAQIILYLGMRFTWKYQTALRTARGSVFKKVPI